MHTKEKLKVIPIDNKILNKYPSVKETFNKNKYFKNNLEATKVHSIKLNNLNLKEIKIENFKKLCNYIFNKYHTINYFYNNDNKIFVSKAGINESVQKIFNNREQREYIKEHLLVFANLGIIIENAYLVNQTLEHKKRDNILHWNYYLCKIQIKNKMYIIEFDVRSMKNGLNQYRIQRIELII